MPTVKQIAGKYYKELKGNLPGAMDLAEELIKTRNLTVADTGIHLLRRFIRHIKGEHFPRFDTWVDYLTNWANTDNLCAGVVVESVKDDPSHFNALMEWTQSPNRWRRRASAVTMVKIASQGGMLDEIFQIADALMTDEDDMVRKGVGWMLKAAGMAHPQQVHEYLVKWKPKTSALVLRYASEKLPKELKVYKSR